MIHNTLSKNFNLNKCTSVSVTETYSLTHTEENQCNGIHYSIQMMSRQPMEAHFESIERTIFCNTFHFMYMHDPQIE